MFEIRIAIRDKWGNPTGGYIEKVFNTAQAVAAFYNMQPGHSIDREFEVYHANSGD